VTQVLPSSTGVIGVELDPRKIIDALPRLVSGSAPIASTTWRAPS
jgi:N-acetylglutamate synthase/N-acetylornithine aminotransferase